MSETPSKDGNNGEEPNDFQEYPVLRLANPLPDQYQQQNDNDNNMYYEQHDNDNHKFESSTSTTILRSSTTPKPTITNLTGIVTNSHPLMRTSPTSPLSPDFPDLIPEKKPIKNAHKNHKVLSKNLSQGAKYSFKPEAHSSHLNLHMPSSMPIRKTNYSTSSEHHSSSFDNSFDRKMNVDLPSIDQYDEQVIDFPESPTLMKQSLKYEMPVEITDLSQATEMSDTDNDKSMYEAILNPNLQNVSLTLNEKIKAKITSGQGIVPKRKKIRVVNQIGDAPEDSDDVSSIESISESLKSDEIFAETDSKLNSNIIQELLESPDDLEDSMFESLSLDPSEAVAMKPPPEPIAEYTAAEERRDSRHWQKIVLPSGEHRSIDMRVIEPYKRVLSHGGYLKAGGHNAIVVFSACFLPDRSRKDYDYVMDNLFLYVLSTLEQLVTEDYVLVYLHGGGGGGNSRMPTLGWLKRCYQLIDHRLRKNLKRLYLVHPTFWLKTIVIMCKPFISSKFYRKINFINSLGHLCDILPIEHASIPEKVKNYERLKFSC